VKSRKNVRRVLACLAAALCCAIVAHLSWTPSGPGLMAVIDAFTSLLLGNGGDALDRQIVLQLRAPRALVAVFGGASLGLAGAVMQAAFRNPLASPDIVGTAAGAALGGAIAIAMGFALASVIAAPIAALLGAWLVTTLVFAFAGTGARFSIAGLLLAGVALNTLVGAVTTFVVTLTVDNYSASSSVLFWLMGGLDAQDWSKAWITLLGFVAFGAPLAWRARELDLLTLQEESAWSLGVDVVNARRWILWLACGLTAATVANTGGITFLGLVVPHLARLLVGPSHRALLPASALLGALVLVIADVACRNLPVANLRLGVVTSALGAPYFLYLLARHRRGEAMR
jgi:iron complex transport system permease protein